MEKEYSIIASKILSILPNTKKILEGKNNIVTIEDKDGIGNLVTSIDKKLEKYLTDNLIMLFPDSQVIGEENADKVERSNCRLKFVIDPLDGTTNFTNEGIVNYSNTVTRTITKKDLSKKMKRGLYYETCLWG